MSLLITDKALRGRLAMFVCQQHPYRSVDGVDEVGGLIDAAAKAQDWLGNDELRMREFAGWSEIEEWLRTVLGEHPQLAKWNTPKSGHNRPFVTSSRYDCPSAQDDFIDIDALLRNIALEAWHEAEREKAWDDDFEARNGPISKLT